MQKIHDFWLDHFDGPNCEVASRTPCLKALAKLQPFDYHCDMHNARKSLCWINVSLLAAHEVDSAYWREWNLFMLPGGPGGFVILHVAVFLMVLWGYEQYVRQSPAGKVFEYVVAGVGLFAVVAHGGFLLAGRPEFRSVVSVILLGGIGAVSIAQLLAIKSK